jgi:hypothetical protein
VFSVSHRANELGQLLPICVGESLEDGGELLKVGDSRVRVNRVIPAQAREDSGLDDRAHEGAVHQ